MPFLCHALEPGSRRLLHSTKELLPLAAALSIVSALTPNRFASSAAFRGRSVIGICSVPKFLGELLFNWREIPAVSKAATRPFKSEISDRSCAKVSLVWEATVSAESAGAASKNYLRILARAALSVTDSSAM